MSSLPREILVDVLRTLDRWTLDAVQITNRRFLQLIEELLSGVCLREITYAHFSSEEGRSSVSPVGRSELQMELSDAHEDFAGFFSAFLNALRNSWIADLCLVGRFILARLRFEACAREGRIVISDFVSHPRVLLDVSMDLGSHSKSFPFSRLHSGQS